MLRQARSQTRECPWESVPARVLREQKNLPCSVVTSSPATTRSRATDAPLG